MHPKPEIRILGVDDSPLIDKNVLVVGTVFRGGMWMDGVLSTTITKDGLDATQRIAEMALESKYLPQLKVIMLDGVTIGGFNVVDLPELHESTGLPVIAVMRGRPDYEQIRAALNHLPDGDRRWEIIQHAGEVYEAPSYDGSVFIQVAGLDYEPAAILVGLAATRSRVPEPIRAAHMIATAIILGESAARV